MVDRKKHPAGSVPIPGIKPAEPSTDLRVGNPRQRDSERIPTAEFEMPPGLATPLPGVSDSGETDAAMLRPTPPPRVESVLPMPGPRRARRPASPAPHVEALAKSERHKRGPGPGEIPQTPPPPDSSDATMTLSPATEVPWRRAVPHDSEAETPVPQGETLAPEVTPLPPDRDYSAEHPRELPKVEAVSKAGQLLRRMRGAAADEDEEDVSAGRKPAIPHVAKVAAAPASPIDLPRVKPMQALAAGGSQQGGAIPKSEAPASAREPRRAPLYAVILRPSGRVNHERLIEELAAFQGSDIPTARRAIRHGKGILARDLSRSSAIVLETALVADGQPAAIVEQRAEWQYEPAEKLDMLKMERGLPVAITASSRTVIEPASLRMIGAGVIAQPAKGESGTFVLELFGTMASDHWMYEESFPLAALTAVEGRVRNIVRLLEDLSQVAPQAVRTPVCELLSAGRVDPKHYYPDQANLDNYHQWLLWASYGLPA